MLNFDNQDLTPDRSPESEVPANTKFVTHTRVVSLVAGGGVWVVSGCAAPTAVADGARDGRVVDVVVLVLLMVTRLIALKNDCEIVIALSHAQETRPNLIGNS